MRALVLSCLLAGAVPTPAADVAPAPVIAVAPAPVAIPDADLLGPDDPPHMPVADLACKVDADCTRVFRRCGTCDCGSPVSVAARAAHETERERRCAAVEGPVCEMDCRDTTPRCVEGRCGLGHGGA